MQSESPVSDQRPRTGVLDPGDQRGWGAPGLTVQGHLVAGLGCDSQRTVCTVRTVHADLGPGCWWEPGDTVSGSGRRGTGHGGARGSSPRKQRGQCHLGGTCRRWPWLCHNGRVQPLGWAQTWFLQHSAPPPSPHPLLAPEARPAAMTLPQRLDLSGSSSCCGGCLGDTQAGSVLLFFLYLLPTHPQDIGHQLTPGLPLAFPNSVGGLY